MGWVMGWAIPEAWFAPLVLEIFPSHQHVFFPAKAAAITRLQSAGSFDCIVGYSLGAQLLLGAAARGDRFDHVALLAPIFAFPSEEKLGGRVARTQVRYLARWLRRDSTAALLNFYERAGLDVPADLFQVGDAATLEWGLECLERDRVEPPLPSGWRAWCGAEDALLDAAGLAALAPEIVVVPGATHHPSGLLRALAGALV
jgi:hypothetical protein